MSSVGLDGFMVPDSMPPPALSHAAAHDRYKYIRLRFATCTTSTASLSAPRFAPTAPAARFDAMVMVFEAETASAVSTVVGDLLVCR